MTFQIKKFMRDEDGAITVDWVVLTAAIIGLSLAVIAAIASGAMDQSNSIGNYLSVSNIPIY